MNGIGWRGRMNRILLIEDEKNFAGFIQLELEHEGYSVTAAFDGNSGLELALSQDWDLVLLDMMLPGMHGLDVCQRIRRAKEKIPILMITARDGLSDRVRGLDSGADDYIPKPFAIEELLARIRAAARRVEAYSPAQPGELTVADLRLDVRTMQVCRADRRIILTKKEFDLLKAFMENVNLVLTREMLLDKVWGFDTEVEANVVDVYVRYLRNKLQQQGAAPLIHTVRGTGYVMRP